MDSRLYATFDTTIGCCAVAFGSRGLSAVGLPDVDRAALVARFERLGQRARSPLPAAAAAAVRSITAHLAGELSQLLDIVLDLEAVPEFDRRVYALARGIPPGTTREYGELATELGGRGFARAVGQALARNPLPLVVPCHRVLGAGGHPGGFSAVGGVALKRRLLLIEGAPGSQLGLELG